MANTTIGIDIAKDHLDIFVLNEQKQHQLPNDSGGIERLLKLVLKQIHAQVIFEATGRYHKALEAALAGLCIILCSGAHFM